MIDTHCHLDGDAFAGDRDAVIARARAAGVTDVVIPAVGPEGWAALPPLCAAAAGLHFGLGIHPQLLPELAPAGDDRRLADLDAALARGGAVAVGECGLDGPSVEAGAPMDRQVAVLRGHLALARTHRLPVIVHCLRAHDALLAVLAAEPLPAGGVLHSWSGSADQVRAFLSFGLHFAFAGPVTYARARKPLVAARAVPRDRLLLETDAPDQTPAPHRGGRNEPAYLPLVAAGLAAALGVSPAELDATTTANARALFRI
ncbi:TatD family hydrolase [Anaeromyxobacter oryzae]|uniref:TatD-related deoxyribonuclease n=1 Tax=Anaeromyxobacter oryzae TaxID=2918170 RepID=A0ABN6N183_9BACT|nr:TatD family hydrolase [Anaeromyxobacter oryzae]BDG06676.1 TatD-related deoxyribonuclease [Anaeromyxobacter oryzae]